MKSPKAMSLEAMKFNPVPVVRFAALLLVIGLVLGTGDAYGATASTLHVFTESPKDGESNLSGSLKDLTTYVFFIFYLLGGIFLGIGAFKLKQGDLPGFGKNMAGGATLFFVPAIIRLFKGLGVEATG